MFRNGDGKKFFFKKPVLFTIEESYKNERLFQSFLLHMHIMDFTLLYLINHVKFLMLPCAMFHVPDAMVTEGTLKCYPCLLLATLPHLHITEPPERMYRKCA